MKDLFRTLVFSDDSSDNWLFKKYYYSGGNARYWTFQLALNVLGQTRKSPIIVETGCQRMKNDIGAGMSTSIFGEFCERYGGKVYTVDVVKEHLNTCQSCTVKFSKSIEYVLSDSIIWLQQARGIKADLLYLDSWDHPIGELMNIYGNNQSPEKALEILKGIPQEEILKGHENLLLPCQQHCLKEFKAAVSSGVVDSKTLILADDNQLPGGGKTRLLKAHLRENGYICVFDHQQTLWVKEL